jgi:alginate O-acetyltransferase complex protein AlgI
MLFNSIDFAIFLPIVFIVYWLLKENLRVQNILIVVASYIFYGWWDQKFLILIAFSTLVDFVLGNALANTDDTKKRKLLLIGSLTVNLGLLGIFKYYNFFAENFNEAFTFLA